MYIIYKMVKRRKMKGKGVKSLLQRGNKFLKDTKLISSVARKLEQSGVAPNHMKNIANVASSYGYGKKRRTRRMRGRGIKECI